MKHRVLRIVSLSAFFIPSRVTLTAPLHSIIPPALQRHSVLLSYPPRPPFPLFHGRSAHIGDLLRHLIIISSAQLLIRVGELGGATLHGRPPSSPEADHTKEYYTKARIACVDGIPQKVALTECETLKRQISKKSRKPKYLGSGKK
jgi:hypothetical protein